MRILVADDNPIILRTLASALRKSGYSFVQAPNGAAAVRAVTEDNFDLAVLSIQLPQVSGIEVARLLRGRKGHEHVPIIFLTHDTSPETEARARSLGSLASYLVKPFRPDALLAAIERALWFDDSATGTKTPDETEGESTNVLEEPATGEAVLEEEPGVPATARRLTARLPDGIDKFLSLLATPNFSVNDISQLVASEPEMSDLVLKRVNSVGFGLSRRMDSAAEACAMMGLRDLVDLILGIGDDPRCREAKHVWNHAIVAGQSASQLMRYLEPEKAEGVGAAGVLHLIGVVGWITALDPTYQQLLQNSERLDWVERERNLLEFDHGELGHRMALEIGVPESVAQTVFGASTIPRITNDEEWLVALVSAATQVRQRNRFRRLVDPNSTLQTLARMRPDLWQIVGNQLRRTFSDTTRSVTVL